MRELVAVLQAFRQFDAIRQQLHDLRPDATSQVLRELIDAIPCVARHVQELERLFDVDLAASSGAMSLREGHDEDYDAAVAATREAERALNQLLQVTPRVKLNMEKMGKRLPTCTQLLRRSRRQRSAARSSSFPAPARMPISSKFLPTFLSGWCRQSLSLSGR